jgi:hypothetical protein
MHKELMIIIFDLSSRERDYSITPVEAETLNELRQQSGDYIECLHAQGILRPWADQILEWGKEYEEDKELVKAGELMLEGLHEE